MTTARRVMLVVVLLVTCFGLMVTPDRPAAAQTAGDCKSDAPSNWEVIASASGGSPESFLCNYKVVREVGGTQFVSGTAITIETYCTSNDGTDAFEGKTGDRGLTETVRVDGERLIVEEGKGARTKTGQPNPDNKQRQGVFSTFFPDVEFRLFEKEWLLLNPQIVATIVVLTNERDSVDEAQRFGVDDIETIAGAIAKRLAPRRSDCVVPGKITAPLGPTKTKDTTGTGGQTTPSTGTGKKGGSKGPLVIAVGGVALGGTAIAVKKRRKRPKFVPPRVYPGGRSNPWDPSLDDQRKKWDRDKLVWDPDTLSWRDPRPEDFVELPEVPTAVESEIPQRSVPTQCLDTYTNYINQQGEARELKRIARESVTQLESARTLLEKNLIRAKAQLGVDIVSAIAGMGTAAIGAAGAAFKPALAGGSHATPIAELGQEAKARAGRRVAELENELSAARSRLAQSQMEMDTAGINRTAVKNAIDLADAEITALERRLSALQDPPATLIAQRSALTAEQAALRPQLDEANRLKSEVADPFLKFRTDASDEFQKNHSAGFNQRRDEIRRLETEEANRPGLMRGPELDDLIHHVQGEVAGGRMTPDDAATIIRNAEHNTISRTPRAREIEAARLALEAESDAAFEQFLKSRPGYRDDFPTWDEASDMSRRPREISKQLKELTTQENKIENQINDYRDSKRAEMNETRGDLASAQDRHKAALEQQKQIESNQLGVDKDKAAVDVIEKQLAETTRQQNEIDRALAEMATSKTPGVIPAVMLGAIFVWLAPGAAAVAVAGILANKGYEALGIGMQSPQEIMQILLENKMRVLTLEKTIVESGATLDALVKTMAASATHLKECIELNKPAVVR